MRARKVFAGRKIRLIRTERGLTQAAFAAQLGISTSYLNQLENNQRHITAPVLLALADVFSVDIKDLSGNEDDRLLADLSEALADPLFAGEPPPAQDLKQVVQNTPAVAHAFLSMHQALRRAGERLAELDDTLERSGAQTDPTPYEEVRDFFHYMDNYIDWLDRAAEDLAGQLDGSRTDRSRALAEFIEARHGYAR
jgi:transcriptional regulator with XRE-family HTH domain